MLLYDFHLKFPIFYSTFISVSESTVGVSVVFVHEVFMKELGSLLQKDIVSLEGRKLFIKSFGFSNGSLSIGNINLFLLNVQEDTGADSHGLQFLFVGILLRFSGNSCKNNSFCSANYNY